MTPPDKNIVVIGGESAEEMKFITPVDEYIRSLTGKFNPSVLYISTANGDDSVKITEFTEKYESAGCTVTRLAFFTAPFPCKKNVSSLVDQADIIYVAGGNTRAMLAVWREFGLISFLEEAWAKGKILCGVSAGAICWFEFGHSDSGGAFALINGIGLLPGALCPHFNSEAGRETSFVQLICHKDIHPAYAVDDGIALHFKNGLYHTKIHNDMSCNGYEVNTQSPHVKSLCSRP
ncbi:peptidase E [Pseudomonas umsongensis]|uniref:Type 1 glutamine amidotransferase-like domain-containing protein n=1 Tax=Pseudomonas umsongensis TaxID=198618 RepID=UPI001248FBBF|nr:peptidase E [Pseudomonas umsongensis]QFG30014.1 peptidase E [Pseudomonas umsongensis]